MAQKWPTFFRPIRFLVAKYVQSLIHFDLFMYNVRYQYNVLLHYAYKQSGVASGIPRQGGRCPRRGGAKLECPLKYQIFKNDL